MAANLHQNQPIVRAGRPLAEAGAAVILIHGRGATAHSILELAPFLQRDDLAFLAPQAANHTWYPYSFLEPLERNEPWLSSALQRVDEIVGEVEAAGIPAEKIVLGGFSQGACLASEFTARHPRRYGGLLVFSGGVIGPLGLERRYEGSGTLEGTPVFLGCSDVDFHIPVERVHETAELLNNLGADVTTKIYPGMGHTIVQDEIDQARQLLARIPAP